MGGAGAFFLVNNGVVATPSISRTTILPSPRMFTAARTLAGLSQEDLARLAGVDRSAISRFERGETLMRTDKLEMVMEALKTCGVRFVGPTAEWDGGIVVVSCDTNGTVESGDREPGSPRGLADGVASARRSRREAARATSKVVGS